MKTGNEKMTIQIEAGSEQYAVTAGSEVWRQKADFQPSITAGENQITFQEGFDVRREEVKTGTGVGIRSFYQGKEQSGIWKEYRFQTLVWTETATGYVYFEWIPEEEGSLSVTKLLWPSPMEFGERRHDHYTLINDRQGMMIPNDWPIACTKLDFDGMFLTAGSYMPWFSQIREGKGYLAIAVTPWNGGVSVNHPEHGPETSVGVHWEPSLGKMAYRRILRFSFHENCDHNTMCKAYRRYTIEQGSFVTLAEKAIRNPAVKKLEGISFVHTGIKTSVNPKSDFYDSTAPAKNNHLTTFQDRLKQMQGLHEKGAGRMYLHLDGWAQPGYDNQHPDYLPACAEAGGWEGLKQLADGMRDMGSLFGIHDQYRDFYMDAASFDPDYACRLTDGTIPEHKRWAGGPQSYLCGTQAPYYVKRNFTEILTHGVKLDGAYLDVFTCNEGDECDNPLHRMTRRDCYEFRGSCFHYLTSLGILPSSEEASDWSIGSLVFCHYAPYTFMLEKPGTPKIGIPVPLYNLVYHDCLVEPWMMEHFPGQEDYMLYALLNGGAPYLVRDGAYAGTDGSFEGGAHDIEEQIARCKVVAGLHEKVAEAELLSHEFVDGDELVQRATFAGGITVTVNFHDNTYVIL